MKIYDIAVIGAGPAGAMAAIRAGQLKRKVVLVERNDAICRKLLLTGRGRCNITNTASIDRFIDEFGKEGRFLRSALFAFSGDDMIDFFKSHGLELKAERQGRVFPVTDKASSVVEALEDCLAENGVKIIYNKRLESIERKNGFFQLEFEGEGDIQARKVVLATGGASFKITGSAGDGYRIAERLGHKIIPLKPGLVPLCTKEKWVKELQGLSLKNVRLTFECRNRKIVSDTGEFIFTHFGISGPLVLDLSRDVVAAMEKEKEVGLSIDLKPGLNKEQLEKRLLREFKDSGRMQLKNLINRLLPRRLVPIFLHLAGLDPERPANQVSQKERRSTINMLKALPLTIVGSLPIEEAMVTSGGISTREIDPRTMESRIVPGLYFAGEMIDGVASSGGYNLQKAFSTGYLSGGKAAHA